MSENELIWHCRIHPVDWWHEIGCPHRVWTAEELLGALIEKKRFEDAHPGTTYSVPLLKPKNDDEPEGVRDIDGETHEVSIGLPS